MSDFSKLKVKKNGKEYVLNVCTQDTEQNITGTKNFTKLTVNSKNVVTSINGLPASEDGNVTITADSTVSIKSTRTSSGSWTITGLTVGKPLYVINSPKYSGCLCSIKATSGTLDTSNSWIGSSSSEKITNIFIVIPTSTTVVFTVNNADDDDYLRAYQ